MKTYNIQKVENGWDVYTNDGRYFEHHKTVDGIAMFRAFLEARGYVPSWTGKPTR